MSDPSDFLVRRIKVALEPGDGTHTVAPAVMIAARLNAAVDGLLEGDLPREVADALESRYVSRFPTSRGSTRPDVAAEMRGLSRLIEAAIATDAARLGVRWSLQTIDQANRLIADAIESCDLLVARARSRFLEHLAPPGSKMTALTETVGCSLLILASPTPMRRPLVFAASGPEITQRALAAALQLGGPGLREVDIVHPANGERAKESAERAESWLREHGCRACALSIRTGSETLSFAAATSAHDLIVAPASLADFEKIDVVAFLQRIRSPVLIVR